MKEELDNAIIETETALETARYLTSIVSNMKNPTAKVASEAKRAWIKYNKAYCYMSAIRHSISEEVK